MTQCIICRARVPVGTEAAHLAQVHPSPVGGFLFYHDERRYYTDRPSMQVTEVRRLVDSSPLYQFLVDQGGIDVALNDGQAVDLTREPHFYSVPPATY